MLMGLNLLLTLAGVAAADQFPPPSPSPSGNIVKHTVQSDGISRIFYAQYPARAEMPVRGWPVVFSFHSWGGTAAKQAKRDALRTLGAQKAVVVHGEGWPMGGSWQSWHGGGSAGANADGGEDGQICNPATAIYNWRCYDSCQEKGYCTKHGTGSNICRWSHCKDDIAAVLAALEAVRAALGKNGSKVDDGRIFATGDSNGAMFMYELASDTRTAKLFSALAPVSGLPHNGFNRGTANTNIRYLTIAGTQDGFVYPFPDVPQDPTESYGAEYGWYYSNWINTTGLWAHQKGLPAAQNKTLFSKSHGQGLTCYGWSADNTPENAQVGTCFYVGAHDEPPNNVRNLIWNFFGFTPEGNELSELRV